MGLEVGLQASAGGGRGSGGSGPQLVLYCITLLNRSRGCSVCEDTAWEPPLCLGSMIQTYPHLQILLCIVHTCR